MHEHDYLQEIFDGVIITPDPAAKQRAKERMLAYEKENAAPIEGNQNAKATSNVEKIIKLGAKANNVIWLNTARHRYGQQRKQNRTLGELTNEQLKQAAGGKGGMQKCAACGLFYEIKYTSGQLDSCPHCGN